MPAATAPSMSVSRRSPTTRGRLLPIAAAASVNATGSGLPATAGSTPVAVRTAATSVPFPGAIPRGVGMVRSPLVATHQAPPLTA